MSSEPLSAHEMTVHRLMAVFGEPRTPDPELFLVEFIKAIKGYPENVLMQACDQVIRENTFWPKPGEIIAIAHRILDSRSRESHADYLRRLDEQEQSWKRPTPEERARTLALFEKLNLKLKGGDGETIDARAMAAQRPAFEAMQRTSSNTRLHKAGR